MEVSAEFVNSMPDRLEEPTDKLFKDLYKVISEHARDFGIKEIENIEDMDLEKISDFSSVVISVIGNIFVTQVSNVAMSMKGKEFEDFLVRAVDSLKSAIRDQVVSMQAAMLPRDDFH